MACGGYGSHRPTGPATSQGFDPSRGDPKRERERERERLILKGAEKSPDETIGGYERHNE